MKVKEKLEAEVLEAQNQRKAMLEAAAENERRIEAEKVQMEILKKAEEDRKVRELKEQ